MIKVGRALKLLVLALFVIFTNVSFNHAAYAQEAVILFDGSGSMKGFKETGSIQDINAALHDLLSRLRYRINASVFVSSGSTAFHDYADFLEEPEWGNETRIDDALAHAMDKDVVVIVTDNVQDIGESSYASARAFYDMLESDAIHSVILLPLKRAFDGRLFFEKNRYPDKRELREMLVQANSDKYTFRSDGYDGSDTSVLMKGERALAVYIIFTKVVPVREMNKFMKSMEDIFSVDPFMVKPIDQGKFFIENFKNEQQVKDWFSRLESTCAPEQERGFSMPPPNLNLMPPPSGIYQPFQKGEDDRYQLVPRKGKNVFPMDRPASMRFYFVLGNRAGSIALGDRDLECSKDIKIKLTNAHFEVPPQYMEYAGENRGINGLVIPPFVSGVVKAATDEIMWEPDMPVFFSEMKVPSLDPGFSLKSVFKLAFVSSVPLRIKGNIEVRVPSGYFSLRDDYRNKYFTNTQLDQSRIYTPEDIVNYVSTKPVKINFDFTSKGIRLLPPAYLKVIFYMIVALLMLAILLFLISVKTRYFLMFDDTGKAIEVYLPLPFMQKVYKREDINVFYVKRGLLGYSVRCAEGFNMEVDGVPKMSVKLSGNIVFHIKGSVIDTIIESVTAGKYSTLEHENFSRIKRIKDKGSDNNDDEESPY